MTRYAILTDGNFDYILAKTGNAMIRYRPEQVACVVDSVTAGKTAGEVLGWGGDIPVVANLKDALRYGPDSLLIGTAPPGGQLPGFWREIVREAITKKLNIVSGLHSFLSDDEEIVALAEDHGVTVTDLRRPPPQLPFSKGSWQLRKTPVLLTVGTDCDTGKMTTAWEIKNRLEKSGKRVAFVGTGQTGILLSGFGVAVDAIVSDFVAGAIEAEIDRAIRGRDLVVVEGQASITHMAYSGVTLGLLHGAMPDMMVLCHEPGRDLDTFEYPMARFNDIMDLYLRLVRVFKKSDFVGISLMTQRMSENQARRAIRYYQREYGIPASDFVRFGDARIIDTILQHMATPTS